MEGEHDGDAFELAPLPAGLADGQGFLHEAAGGGGAEADNELGLDDSDLALEVGDAAFHFLGGGHAVAGGAAFDDVADEHLFAGVAHGFDHLGEELAGAADEGETLFILVGAGAFADEHDVGPQGALAGNGVGAGGGEGAGLAGGDFRSDGGERVLAAGRGLGDRGAGGGGRGGLRGFSLGEQRGGGRGGAAGGGFGRFPAGGGDMGNALFLEVLEIFDGLIAEGLFHVWGRL